MKDYPLEECALEWLRYEHRCFVVCTERTPILELCRPDVLGLMMDRRLIEVEVKRSTSDFRANGNKRGIKFRMHWPAQFYFMVHPEIAEKVLAELNSGLLNETYQRSGLLTVSTSSINSLSGLPQTLVIRRSPVNKSAVKLSVNQTARMVRDQSGTLCGMAATIWRLRQAQPLSPGRPAVAESGATPATAGEPSNSLRAMAGEHRGEL